VNGKAKYKGWQVRCDQWNPKARYSIDSLASAFGIDLAQFMPQALRPRATISASEGMKAFVAVRQSLRAAGMMKGEGPDIAGWQDVICPWLDEHSGRVDNGAAIREPAEENGWVGAFRCHHGSCVHRGWRDLTDLLNDEAELSIKTSNESAPDWKTVQGWL